MKFWIKPVVIFLILIISTITFIQGLETGHHKNFWLDEIGEIYGPLKGTPKQMLIHGAGDTPSPSPLYFVLEQKFLIHVLEKEKVDGHGLDWRVSLRLLPSFSLALGGALAAMLILPVSWLWALSLPIMLGNMGFLMWYAGETRIYAAWVGVSVIFYIGSILLFCAERTFLWGLLWVFLSWLLTMIMITAPAQVLSTGCTLLFLAWFINRALFNKIKLWIIAACVLSFFTSLWYRGPYGHLGFHEIVFSWPSFVDHVLLPLGKLKGAIEYIVLCLCLSVASFKIKTKFSPYYFITGVLGMAQLLALFLLFIMQYLEGYWWAERHGIFICAIEAVVRAAGIVLVCEILEKIITTYIYVSKKIKWGAMGSIIFVAFYLSWFQQKVMSLRSAFRDLKTAESAYCHIPLWYPTPKVKKDDFFGLPVEQFNSINILRHAGGPCLKVAGDEEGAFFDFSPPWLYPAVGKR